MAYLNEIRLIGNVTADPVFREFEDGRVGIRFNVCISRKDRRNEDNDVRQFYTVKMSVTKDMADFVGDRMGKGALVHVSGEHRKVEYENPNGDTVHFDVIQATDLQVLLSPRKQDHQEGRPAEEAYEAHSMDEREADPPPMTRQRPSGGWQPRHPQQGRQSHQREPQPAQRREYAPAQPREQHYSREPERQPLQRRPAPAPRDADRDTHSRNTTSSSSNAKNLIDF